MDLAQITVEDFRSLLEQEFEVDVEGVGPITLVEVEPKPRRDQHERDPFTIVLRAAGTVQLPQGMYTLRNGAIGAVELFLVPVDQGLYEAVFN